MKEFRNATDAKTAAKRLANERDCDVGVTYIETFGRYYMLELPPPSWRHADVAHLDIVKPHCQTKKYLDYCDA